jgi:hypothetical protein
VVIIPKKPSRYNKEFTPSDNKKGEKCPPNSKIREIDGASFYSIVTGHINALQDLFNALPSVIKEVSGVPFDKNKLEGFFKKAYG